MFNQAMKISIIGLGWYGEALARVLLQNGHEVVGTTRTEAKMTAFQSESIETYLLSFPQTPSEALLDSDVVILNIPPFAEELEWFKQWNWNPRSWIIFISSAALFPKAESKNAFLLEEQEEWVKKSFTKWSILRFGGLIGAGRHPGKSLSGRKNLSGRLWPVNLIHQKDAVGFTLTVLNEKLQNKTFLVVSDEHPNREEFYRDYCLKQGLPLPEFDQNDMSSGKTIPNQEVCQFYSSFHSLTEE